MLARAGIIGSSGVGALHADALRRLGVPIAAIAAATVEIARRDAERLGVAVVHDSAEDLVADDAIDVVHVCTPNALHVRHCRAALEAGKHVVAEKPLATSVAGAEALVRLAKATGTVHALCQSYRHYPMIQALRALIAEGRLGRVHTVHGAWLSEELLAIEPGHWMLDPSSMGPSLSLADAGVHLWDLFEHVTDDTIGEVICETRAARTSPGEGEDSAVFALRMAGGAIASGTVCQAAAGHGNTLALEVIGDRASAAWDIRTANLLTVRELGGTQRILERATRPVDELGALSHLQMGQPEGHADALRDLLARVYERIHGASSTEHPTFEDGLRGLCVLDALSRSALDGRWTPVVSP